MRKYNIQVRTSTGEIADKYEVANLEIAFNKIKELEKRYSHFYIISLHCILKNK